MAANSGLSNNAYLSKIDQLRETNVGSLIPLPQVIVVGDQSSGKSSTLESLTGFAFPRATTLCTRYATQISCIRAPTKEITVSIIPRLNASADIKARLQAFRHTLDKMDAQSLACIFQEANIAMGIQRNDDDEPGSVPAFSEDTLKIDISGPNETHLTLVDIPGIFRVPTPGVTTDSDIQLVRNMVQRYMENPRTIILAVIPCNVDIASQEILRLAADADPEGIRTMGVLTKPDLAKERAVQDVILELINGQRNPLKLGYCVIQNRGADDNSSSAHELEASERAFFQAAPWSTCNATALGADALRTHLRSLLLDISKREYPHVRAQIESRRRVCAEQLDALGPSRADEMSQRRYLVNIASHAQDLILRATNGDYTGSDGLFQRVQSLRLITRLVRQNEIFSSAFAKFGHIQNFRETKGKDKVDEEKKLERGSEDDSSDDSRDGPSSRVQEDSDDDLVQNESDLEQPKHGITVRMPFNQTRDYDDIQDIVILGKKLAPPQPGPLYGLIRRVYQNSRGPELGTFNGAVLATLFRTITTRWELLMQAHVSKSILFVHDFMHHLLEEVCPDHRVRRQLWDVLLRDELRGRYCAAMKQGKFLLGIERSGLPVTMNAYFNKTIKHKRQEDLVQRIEGCSKTISNTHARKGSFVEMEPLKYIPFDDVKSLTLDMEHNDMVCEDLLNAVESYYKVARERFVDTLCQQVIYHMLLTGPDSPLYILSPNSIMLLSADQLEAIAGEDSVTVNQRQILRRQLDSLEEAMKVMRS